jgi:hypothetical protein
MPGPRRPWRPVLSLSQLLNRQQMAVVRMATAKTTL